MRERHSFCQSSQSPSNEINSKNAEMISTFPQSFETKGEQRKHTFQTTMEYKAVLLVLLLLRTTLESLLSLLSAYYSNYSLSTAATVNNTQLTIQK